MRKTAALLLATALSLTVAACGSTTTSSGTAATTTTAVPSNTGVTGATKAPTGSTVAKKISANTASTADIVAALTAAGVSNPSRWANEIEEYRPYDTSDASLSKLKSELAKYNPGADTLNKILSVLEP